MGGRRRWLFVMGIVLMGAGFAAPAGAAGTSFDESCAEVYGKRAVGDLEKTTDPSPGTGVSPGQRVSVTLRWPTFAVAGERAHRVMECLSIDGGPPRLWAERRFTSAEGTVSLAPVVPAGVSPKSAVCGQSFLKTQGSFGPVTRWSEKTCYPAGKSGSFSALARSPSPPAERPAPESRSTSTTRAPLFSPRSPSPSPPSSSTSRDDYEPPWPPWEKGPKVSASPPATTVTTTAALEKTPTTRKSAAAEEAAPATTPTSAPSSTLPRTGAGVIVLLGIAAVALFSGRTLRRASYVIEDNLPVPAVPVGDEEDDPTLVLGRRWY